MCTKFMPINLVELEIFHWLSDNFDLLAVVDEKVMGSSGLVLWAAVIPTFHGN